MNKPLVMTVVAFAMVITVPMGAQQTAPSTTLTTPTTAAADVMPCVHAQMVVDRLLAGGMARLETARQSNSVAEMRAAIDSLQTTLRDARAQLAPCGKAEEARDPHALHTVPSTAAAAPTTPAASKPTAAPKPTAEDPHAGHTMPAAKPAPAPAKPPTAKPVAKPSARDPHAGHTAAPAKPAPKTAKPAAPPKSPASDPHAGHTPAPSAPPTPSASAASAMDPVCGLRVDTADAPSTKYGGQTYYFCSIKHRDLFASNPAKFLPKK